MGSERHVKLFKNGRNQAVRIPREFESPGDEAILRKEGERLVIEPAPPKSLLAVLSTHHLSRNARKITRFSYQLVSNGITSEIIDG